MSKNSQNSIIDLNDETLKDILLQGNIFDSPKKIILYNILQQI